MKKLFIVVLIITASAQAVDNFPGSGVTNSPVKQLAQRDSGSPVVIAGGLEVSKEYLAMLAQQAEQPKKEPKKTLMRQLFKPLPEGAAQQAKQEAAKAAAEEKKS